MLRGALPSSPVSILIAVVAAWTTAALLGCDDTSGTAADSGSGDAAGDTGDAATGDASDGGGDAAPDGDGDASSGDAGDVEPDAAERTCGQLPAQDETATYDVLSPLAAFVGFAQVTKSGLGVSVSIVDPSSEDPTVFEGDFSAGTRCVAATYNEIDADLCFFDPDGSGAVPESLGAFLYAFIAGAPHERPNATLLGAVRREVDLSCTPAGFYTLDGSGLTLTSGDLGSVETAVREQDLSYLAIFETHDGQADIAMGMPPIIEPVDTFDVGGSFETVVPLSLVIQAEGVEQDYDVDVTLSGTIDLETGALTAEATVDVSGGEPAQSGTLSGTLTGQRP